MPLRSYIPTEKGPNGVARIKVLPRSVQVTFTEGEYEGKTYEIDRLQAPENVRDGVFVAALNFEEDRLFDPLPPGGKGVSFIVTYAGIDHKKDEPPMPMPDNGRSYDYIDQRSGQPRHVVEPPSRIFRVRWKIIDGLYQGCIIPQTLRYLFEQWEDTSEAWIVTQVGDPFTGWGRRLLEFIRLSGFDEASDVIPYTPDGIGTLLYIDKMAKSKKRVLTAFPGKKGWVNRLGLGPAGMSLEDYLPQVNSEKAKAESEALYGSGEDGSAEE